MKRRRFIRQSVGAIALSSLAPSTILQGSGSGGSLQNPYICIFSKHLQWLGFREMARLTREIGFTGIDLTVRRGGHVEPENAEKKLPLAVRIIREEGLEVPMITTGITDPEDPVTRTILKSASQLGIPLYRTGWFLYEDGIPVQEQLTRAAGQMRKLSELCREYHISASYQNHAGKYIGSSGWDLLRIIEGLDPAWMGVQFDIRHAMVEGPESWPYVFEMLAPYINSLDVKDFTWGAGDKGPVVSNVPLGKGMVPFDTYFQMLNGLAIDADFCLHLEYPLGGAEHGSKTLDIPEASFREQVKADLDFLKERLFS